jgi:hypothetical protein
MKAPGFPAGSCWILYEHYEHYSDRERGWMCGQVVEVIEPASPDVIDAMTHPWPLVPFRFVDPAHDTTEYTCDPKYLTPWPV